MSDDVLAIFRWLLRPLNEEMISGNSARTTTWGVMIDDDDAAISDAEKPIILPRHAANPADMLPVNLFTRRKNDALL